MKNNIFWSMLAIIVSIIIVSLITLNNKRFEINELNTKIYNRDIFIKEYISKIYYLKDEITLNKSTKNIIHQIDSISYDFFYYNPILDYNIYALDIVHHQEQLRYETIEKHEFINLIQFNKNN